MRARKRTVWPSLELSTWLKGVLALPSSSDGGHEETRGKGGMTEVSSRAPGVARERPGPTDGAPRARVLDEAVASPGRVVLDLSLEGSQALLVLCEVAVLVCLLVELGLAAVLVDRLAAGGRRARGGGVGRRRVLLVVMEELVEHEGVVVGGDKA